MVILLTESWQLPTNVCKKYSLVFEKQHRFMLIRSLIILSEIFSITKLLKNQSHLACCIIFTFANDTLSSLETFYIASNWSPMYTYVYAGISFEGKQQQGFIFQGQTFKCLILTCLLLMSIVLIALKLLCKCFQVIVSLKFVTE